MRFQQAPHTCGTAQSADPRLGAVGRVGETIHSSAQSPWILLLLPMNILRVASSCPSSSTAPTQAQKMSQAGMGRLWAGQGVLCRRLLMESFPLSLSWLGEGCGPLM